MGSSALLMPCDLGIFGDRPGGSDWAGHIEVGGELGVEFSGLAVLEGDYLAVLELDAKVELHGSAPVAVMILSSQRELSLRRSSV